MMDMSIIIVSWNTREYLIECLQSVEDTSCGLSYETLVVDNGSVDDSVEVVRRQFPNVRVIEAGENLGFAKANNIGITHANGRYLAFVNSDVKVLPDCFQRLIHYMDKHSEIGLAGPRILNTDGSLQPSCRRAFTLWTCFCTALALNRLFPKSSRFADSRMEEWAHDEIRTVSALTGCFWLARRESVEEIGLLDESFFMYGEDIDWCNRFIENGWKVVFYPEAQSIHHGGGSSRIKPTKYFVEMHKAALRLWEKNHGTISTILYVFLAVVHHSVRIFGYGLLSLLCQQNEANLYHLQRHWQFLRWLISGQEGEKER